MHKYRGVGPLTLINLFICAHMPIDLHQYIFYNTYMNISQCLINICGFSMNFLILPHETFITVIINWSSIKYTILWDHDTRSRLTSLCFQHPIDVIHTFLFTIRHHVKLKINLCRFCLLDFVRNINMGQHVFGLLKVTITLHSQAPSLQTREWSRT